MGYSIINPLILIKLKCQRIKCNQILLPIKPIFTQFIKAGKIEKLWMLYRALWAIYSLFLVLHYPYKIHIIKYVPRRYILINAHAWRHNVRMRLGAGLKWSHASNFAKCTQLACLLSFASLFGRHLKYYCMQYWCLRTFCM